MKSAHSLTLSNEARDLSTREVYFFHFGSAERALLVSETWSSAHGAGTSDGSCAGSKPAGTTDACPPLSNLSACFSRYSTLSQDPG